MERQTKRRMASNPPPWKPNPMRKTLSLLLFLALACASPVMVFGQQWVASDPDKFVFTINTTGGVRLIDMTGKGFTSHQVQVNPIGGPSAVSVTVAADNGSGFSTVGTSVVTTSATVTFQGTYNMVRVTATFTGGSGIAFEYGGAPEIQDISGLATEVTLERVADAVESTDPVLIDAVDPCFGAAKTNYVINSAAAATVEIANASADNNVYVCSINVVAGAAQGFALALDDTDGCGSVVAATGLNGGITGATGWQFAANGGIALGDGNGTVLKGNTVNRYFCMVTSTSAQTSGAINYVLAP